MSTNPFAPASGGGAPPAKPVRAARPPPPNPFATGGDTHGERPKSVAKPSFLKSDVSLSSSSTLSSGQHSPSSPSPKESSTNPFGPPPVPVVPPSPSVSSSNPFGPPPVPVVPPSPSVSSSNPFGPPPVEVVSSSNPFAANSPAKPSAAPPVPPPLPQIAPPVEEEHDEFVPPPIPSVPIPETPKDSPPPPPVPFVPPSDDFSHDFVSTPAVPPPKAPFASLQANDGFDHGFAPTASHATGFEVDALASSWDTNLSVSSNTHDGFGATTSGNGFDFQSSSNAGFDSFGVSNGFDSFNQSNTSGFATQTSAPPVPPPTIVEDDPYDIVVNKPPPKPVTSFEVPKVSHRRESAPVPAANKSSGDPFEVLVAPLKPKPAAAPPVIPLIPSKPLKDMVHTNVPTAPILPILEAPTPQVDDDPYEIHVVKQKPVQQTAPPPQKQAIAGFDDFGASTVDPFVQPVPSNSTAGFGFDSFGATSSSDPFSAPASGNSGFDSFGFSSNTNNDPFGNPTPVPVAPPSDADFEIFNKPTKASNPFHPTAPTTSHHIQSNAHDLDIFNSPPKPKTVTNPPQNIFSPTSKAKPAHDDLDIFNAPVSLSAPPGPLYSTSSAANTKSSGQSKNTAASTSISDDPFFVGFENDPFSAPASNNHKEINLLGDPFEDDFNPQTNHEEEEDPMKKLRQVYNLRKNSDASDAQLSDHLSDTDPFDDDVDNYESKYIRKRDPPAQQPVTKSTGSTTTTGTAGMKGRYDIDESELMDGEILSRMSTKSLVTKDWHDTYYVIKGNHLYLYRNKLDYQYNPNGTNYKKKIPITHNLRVLQIKSKEYKGLGPVYNFMLEEVMDYGPSNVGKFGSTYRAVIETLWKRLRYLILKRREARAHPPPQYGK